MMRALSVWLGRACVAALLCGSSVAAQSPLLQFKPLAGGTITVASVSPRYTTLDMDALTERLDIALNRVLLWDRAHLGFDPATDIGELDAWSNEAVAERLAGFLGKKKPAVVVLANLDAAALPESFQSTLKAYVEQGGGLALSYVDVPETGSLRDLLASVVPVEEDPGFKRGLQPAYAPDGTDLADAARASAYGNGRVVEFVFPGDVPRHHALFPPPAPGLETDPHHLNHACALWGRTLLWLAKRDDTPKITAVVNASPQGPSDAEVPPDLPEEFIASMRDSVVAQSMRSFSMSLYEPAERGYGVHWRVRPILDAAPGYHTEGSIEKGSAATLTQLFTGPGTFYVDTLLMQKQDVVDWYSEQVTIADWPEIESIRADKTFLLANDRLTVDVDVRSVYSAHRSATVYAQALDSYGRLVAQAWQPISNAGGRVTLTMNFADLIAPLVEVRILAIEGEPHRVIPWDFYAGALDRLRFPVHFTRRDAHMNWGVATDTLLESNAETYIARLHALGVTHVAASGGRPALVAAARNGVLLTPVAADYQVEAADESFARVPSFASKAFAEDEDERLRGEVLDYFAGGSGAYLLGDPALVVNSAHNACQSPQSLTDFRAWAEKRNITVPADDESLMASIRPAEDVASAPAQHHADFRLFMESQFEGFLAARRQTIRRAHPDALVGIGALTDANPYRGYNWHALATGLDFVAADWDPVAVFQLSTYGARSPMSGFRAATDWSVEQQTRGLWFSAVAGFGMVWTPQPFAHAFDGGMGLLLNEDGAATDIALAMGQTLEQCNDTLAPLLREATPTTPLLSILDAPRSRHATPESAQRHAREQEAWTKTLARLGHWPHFTHASEVGDAASRGLRVLFVSASSVLDAQEQETLKAFAASGGLVWTTTDGSDTLRSLLGEGSVQTLPDDPTERMTQLITALKDAGISSPLPFDSKGYEKNVGTDLLTRSFRYGAADIHVSLPWPVGGVEKPAELSLGFDKDDFVFQPLNTEQTARSRKPRLNRDAPTVVTRLDYDVRELQLLTGEAVMAGERVEAQCIVAVETVSPGKHLVLLTLSPPSGKPIAGGRRWVTCERGRGASYIPVPLNAIPGAYTLRARDLLTGLETRKMIEVIAPSGPGFQALH